MMTGFYVSVAPRSSTDTPIGGPHVRVLGQWKILLGFQSIVERLTVALPASLQMFAHDEAHSFGIASFDCLVDSPVLRLDLLKVNLSVFCGLRLGTYRSRRNDGRSERMHQSFKIRIARRRRNCAMKIEIGLNSRVARGYGHIDRVETPPHFRKVLIAALLGSDGRRLEFNGQSKLEDILDVGQGASLIRNNAERLARSMIRHVIPPSPDG